MKYCSKCKINECAISHRYCLKCKALSMRIFRKYNKLNNIQKLKANCRSYSNTYLSRGKLKKEDCIICGSNESEKHHPNYYKPLEVIWLCRKCHLELHKCLKHTNIGK